MEGTYIETGYHFDVKYEINYVNYIEHGKVRGWHSNECLYYKFYYVQGQTHGLEHVWYNDGTRERVVTWQMGSWKGVTLDFNYEG